MKLNRKHIGGLFHIDSSDGSWVYQLVDVKDGWLLFYEFDGDYYKEKAGADDWVRFKPHSPWPENQLRYGWLSAKDK